MSNSNLYALFQSGFPPDSDQISIDHDRVRLSFAQLEHRSACMAATLKAHNIAMGERVLVQVEKSPEAVLLYLACLRIGAVFVPLNPAYTPAELEYFVADAAPRLFICSAKAEKEAAPIARKQGIVDILTLNDDGTGGLIDLAAQSEPDTQIASVQPDDVAAIIYTSGTTGRSKGAMITHHNLTSNARVLHDYWHFVPGDILLHALPIFHVHGLFVALHCALLNGSRMIFLDRFDLDRVIAELPNATLMMGVPTFYVRLLADRRFSQNICRNIRLFISGSAPLLSETFEGFEARTGHKILERYGMSEAGMITSNPCQGERIAGTVGFALPGVKLRVTDGEGAALPAGKVGMLEICGPNLFAGYWRRREITAQEFRPDGYFITGDLAIIDKTGRVSIIGRSKDLIISGGFNIYPKEIESQIDAMEGVVESAVIGVSHPDFGEGVTAIIVADGSAPINEETLKGHLASRLAGFKHPKAIFIVKELPRNTMGKVQKNQLRRVYADIYRP